MGQADAFELDVAPARAVEQPDTVAEHDGGDEHQDLVEHTRIEALLGRVGAEDIDVLVTGSGLGCGNAAFEVADEGDTRHRTVRRVMCEHELWSGPAPAERLACLGRALVRIVAAKGAVPDEEGADVAMSSSTVGLGPRCSVSQDMSPPGPAMKPSSDIVTE